MFAMFAKFFSMLTLLFSAGEKGAQALDTMSDVAVDSATAYREAKRTEHAALAKQLPKPEQD